jgi:ferredoxin-NADP reductase
MKLTFKNSFQREGDVRTFAFEVPEGFGWTPGQYMHYVLPHLEADNRGTERWFTIASAPSEGEIHITTRINAERSSSFKTALLGLQPGDEVEADGPEGSFVLQDPSRNYIFIAGGIGITPFRSILVESATNGQKLNVRLLYPNRTEEIAFRSELDKLAADNPGLKIEYIVQPERLTPEHIKEVIDSCDNPLIYVSGPEPMVKALVPQIQDMLMPGAEVKSDDFPGYEAD